MMMKDLSSDTKGDRNATFFQTLSRSFDVRSNILNVSELIRDIERDAPLSIDRSRDHVRRTIDYIEGVIRHVVLPTAISVVGDVDESSVRLTKQILRDAVRSARHKLYVGELEGDITRDGSNDVKLMCHVCDKYFAKTFHYLQHMRVHYRLRMYSCSMCGESFVQKNGLDYHVRNECRTTERTNDVSFEYCTPCCEFVRTGDDMRLHVLRRHARENIDLAINIDQYDEVRRALRQQR